MSERDGWNHLYLYDGATGAVKNQITQRRMGGARRRQGRRSRRGRSGSAPAACEPGEDPYFAHYYRVNFDGSGLTPLTAAPANHVAAFSTDMQYFVDT